MVKIGWLVGCGLCTVSARNQGTGTLTLFQGTANRPICGELRRLSRCPPGNRTRVTGPEAQMQVSVQTTPYLKIIFISVTTFGSNLKNGIPFALKMEMLMPKMATVTSNLLYFLVGWINWYSRYYTGCSLLWSTMETFAIHLFFWYETLKLIPEYFTQLSSFLATLSLKMETPSP